MGFTGVKSRCSVLLWLSRKDLPSLFRVLPESKYKAVLGDVYAASFIVVTFKHLPRESPFGEKGRTRILQ